MIWIFASKEVCDVMNYTIFIENLKITAAYYYWCYEKVLLPPKMNP